MKPIGSEKIENVDDKLARILEIAGIKKELVTESAPVLGHLSNVLHEAVAANGTEYGIVQEEKHKEEERRKKEKKYVCMSDLEYTMLWVSGSHIVNSEPT